MAHQFKMRLCWALAWTAVISCSLSHGLNAQESQLQDTPGSSSSTIKSADNSSNAGGVSSGDVELRTSRVYVRVGKVGLGHEHGASGKLQSGTLHLDAPGSDGTYGRLVFDMTSFEADSDEARKYVGLQGSTDENTRKQVNENLLGKEVLDVAAYPTATFEIKQVTKQDQPGKRGLPIYKFEGDFTLHGVTKPLVFLADVEVVKGWNHIRGGFRIRQTDYGIKPYSKMLGAVGVADQLLVLGDLIAAP